MGNKAQQAVMSNVWFAARRHRERETSIRSEARLPGEFQLRQWRRPGHHRGHRAHGGPWRGDPGAAQDQESPELLPRLAVSPPMEANRGPVHQIASRREHAQAEQVSHHPDFAHLLLLEGSSLPLLCTIESARVE